jgi:hypothetical protein
MLGSPPAGEWRLRVEQAFEERAHLGNCSHIAKQTDQALEPGERLLVGFLIGEVLDDDPTRRSEASCRRGDSLRQIRDVVERACEKDSVEPIR